MQTGRGRFHLPVPHAPRTVYWGEIAMTYKFSVIIEKEKDWCVGLCPELEVASQGKTIEEAYKNLQEAVKLYLETADKSEIEISKIPPLVTSLEIAIG